MGKLIPVTEIQKMKVNIVLDEYNYDCSDGCCTNYGIITSVNGVELSSHNMDTDTILKQVLEHLGYQVEVISKYNGECDTKA